MIRRFVNLVVESGGYGRRVYSLHRLDAAKHPFYPSTADAEAANNDSKEIYNNNNGGGGADSNNKQKPKPPRIRRLPPASLNFPTDPEYEDDMCYDSLGDMFTLLRPAAGGGEGRILHVGVTGHGLVYDADARSVITTTCEENAEKFISELINLSIIQEPASSKVFCQINGFFHEYIISRPMQDNLVFALEEGCSLNSQRTGQHLTIRRSWDRRDRIVYESIDFSRLRSLTVFGEWKPFFICSKKVNMRLLRVLDLEDATDVTNEDLDKIAKLLTRLKFLSLRGHTKITCLPISMGGLRQLQTLDIRGTFIVMLPLFITKLQKLQYIRAGTTEVGDILPAAPSSEQAVTNLPTEEGANDSIADDAAGSSVSCNNRTRTLVTSLLFKLCRRGGSPTAGVTVPADIGKLSVLHTLGVVKVNKQAIFEALKQLTQLCKLSVSGINKGNIQEFCSAIADHARLRSLSVELDKDDGLDDNIPLPPKTVKRLKLYGHVRKLLPVWLEYLRDLEKVHLTVEKPEELRDLPALSNKPYVGHLRIRPIQSGELRIGTCCWIYAMAVEIQCSSTLHIKFDHDEDGDYWGFALSVLKVHFSGGSQSSLQISGLDRLMSLKEVWLRGYTNAHKQYMQQQINDMELVLLNQERPVLKLVPPSSS